MSPDALRRTVLIADADPGTRTRVREAFDRLGCTTVEADDGRAALEHLRASTPALVVADVELPEISGYELCREVKDAHGDAVGFILVSAQRTDVVDRVAGLLVGADDYLGKPFETDELLARARRFLRTAQPRAPRGGRLGRLTPRETEVLELLLDGLTVKEIASRLVISPKTAATHLQRILGKLDVHSRAQAVAVVLGEGAGARVPAPSAGRG